MEPTYKSYEDWYDRGPGSESFKRSCLGPNKAIEFPDFAPDPPDLPDMNSPIEWPDEAERPASKPRPIYAHKPTPGGGPISPIFKDWAKDYWEKPLILSELLKREKNARILMWKERLARILKIIQEAKRVILLDAVLEKGARISRELEKRDNDIAWGIDTVYPEEKRQVAWEKAYVGVYDGD
jgi:hypothetical protein